MMMSELITDGADQYFIGGAGVFISSSTEVRKGLPDHLRARLRTAGMRVFKDVDDFPKGVNLRDATRRAIESSAFSVVVLSRRFASSVSRLDELVQIKEKEVTMMKTSSDPRQHNRCFPIFLHISPDEGSQLLVGSGAGSCFHADIQRHEPQPTYRKFAWTDALAWLSGIGGWVLNADRPEAEVVELVATTIQERLRGNLFTGHLYHDPYPIWDKPIDPPPAAASAASSAATLPFRMLIVAAAFAFSGAAAIGTCYIYMCNCCPSRGKL